VKPNRIYVDHGLTGTNRARHGLREALAACRSGDTPAQEADLVELWRDGKHTSGELAELFGVARSTVYRAVHRAPGTGTSASASRVSAHVFVDESKQRDYLLVAAAIMPGDLAGARRTLRALVMPGQRRLHMKKESDARRHTIIDAITSTGASATIYDAGRRGRRELDAREGCLRALVVDLAAARHQMLVLEQDDSLLWWDQQRLIEITRQAGCRDTLRYEHRRGEHEAAPGLTRRNRMVLGQGRPLA
jgi:hypothetical protein